LPFGIEWSTSYIWISLWSTAIIWIFLLYRKKGLIRSITNILSIIVLI
jgi:hypothetical protein